MSNSDIDQAATREPSRVALVTCAEFLDLDPDDRLLLAPLAAAGVRAEAVAWDDPGTDWAAYDLVVLRSAWDYAGRRDAFVDWAARVPRLANPADVVVWNTDKRYLRDLEASGVPVVPTAWVENDGGGWVAPGADLVVKPAVGAGSVDAGRYRMTDPQQRIAFGAHLRRLVSAGRVAMVQPYLSAVDTDGETALVFLDGPDGLRFSHAARKAALLHGPDEGVKGLFKKETIDPREATDAQLAVAEKALAAVPGGPDRLLYARVDLVPDETGAPTVIELELTEPSLFLGHREGAAARLASAIMAAAGATPAR